ncbi:hypothetical protein GE09DRAFT_59790 [Coniochaeta sp. 2T2.1]|nr:hypothetical protein GE09DRAFT_59790 [Coniochaeta sp. 2T2.1]
MPTYHSPSSSPSRSPRPSVSPPPRRRSNVARIRSRRRSPSPSSSISRSTSRSRSRSRPRSASRSRTQRLRDKFPDDGLSEAKSESIVKTSLVFLGAVGAATFAAHKFWPKGITYGEKEEWECVEKKKVRVAIRDAEDGERRRASRGGREDMGAGRDNGGRGDGRRGIAAAAGARGAAGYAASSSSGGSRGDREGGRERERDRGRDMYMIDERNSGRGGTGAGGGYYAREEVIVRDNSVDPRPRSQLRERSMSRERDYRAPSRGAGRYDAALPAAVVERRTNTRKEVEYYPPSPPRLTVERGGGPMTGGSTRDRSRSVVYDDEPEVVYVRRESGAGGRYSVSATAGSDTTRPRSRYDDGHYR